jgi:hypothetical protein
VLVLDNSDLAAPYRRIAVYENGTARELAKRLPRWFRMLRAKTR